MVKKIIAPALALCAAALSAAAPAAPLCARADAADGGLSIPADSDYVSEFAVDGVRDFAVSEAEYAFCAGDGSVYVYAVDGKAEGVGSVRTFIHERGVVRTEYCLDAAAGVEGALYFEDSSGASYRLTDDGAEEAPFVFTEYDESYTVSRVTYYIDMSGRFVITDMNDNTQTITDDGGFFGLKSVSGRLYVMGGSSLYEVDGKEMRRIGLPCEDDAAMNAIATADTAERLAEGGAAIVSVAEGAVLVEVDPESFGDEYFTAYRLSESAGGVAQLLLFSGNAAVIVYGGAACLTLRENVTVRDYEPEEFLSTAYALTDAAVYALPFACTAAEVGGLSAGDEVRTLSRVSGTAFPYDYVEIEYGGGSGYVLSSLLSPYAFAGGDGGASRDTGEASYDSVLYTAILAAALVALVIALVAYVLTVAGGRGRRRGRGGGSRDGA